MMSKAKAGIVLIVIIGALALVPVALYGTEVNVAKVNIGLNIGGTTAVSLSEFGVLQIPSFTAGMSGVQIDVESMNPYSYMIERNTARTQVDSPDSSSAALVEISIFFNLTTPSNNSITFTLTPGSQGTGEHEVTTLLGPEEGLDAGGEFHLTITITIRVTPPGFDEPVVDLNLSPVNRTFTVPTSG
ncbi:MAG: hypothetical protein BAJATHORv1_10552 [Candidatus Thorarchaeota archaeon]|nr:MAG: hypothetical protein BAJATHORv1_10552 [Candidatus Thorarchaeota archaeon]